MHDVNRDLLVLSDTTRLSAEEIEREVSFLNGLLFHIENWETFSVANEVMDINRRKIINDTVGIRKVLGEKKVRAFVFTCNKN
jgi:hypothetical protein